MKLYYFNDRPKRLHVFYATLHELALTIEPKCGAWLDVPVGNDEAPYIKQWDTGVMLVGSIALPSLEAHAGA